MSYVIREALIEDYDSVNQLSYELYHLHYQNRPDIFNDTLTCFSKEAYIKELNDSNIYVIEDIDNKKVLGYTCFQIFHKKQTLLKCQRNFLYIDDVVITKNSRKQGLGSLLQERIIEIAKENNCTTIELEVFDFNESAIQFYQTLGYHYKTHSMEIKIKK